MKYIILILLLFLAIDTLYSQNSEPKPMEFIWGSSSNQRPLVVDSFPQKNFLTGFQWTGNNKMNHALLNNATTSGELYWESGTNYKTPRYAISQPTYIRNNDSSTGYGVGIWNAPAMHYEPTLRIPNNDSAGKYFIHREHDQTNAIFGFKYIRGQILDSTQYNDENYNRLILHKSTDTGKVLADVWPKPEFITFNGNNQSAGYYGEKWNLSINLRRLNTTENIVADDSVVLKIKLPYKSINKFRQDTIYTTIRFDYVPENTIDSIVGWNYPNRNDYRGYEIKRHRDTTNIRDTVLRITRRMLNTNNSLKDITISSHFMTYNQGIIEKDNPPFKNSINDYFIDSIDIEVEYKGLIDICLDLIKLESDEAYYISRGCLDSLSILDPNTPNERPESINLYPVHDDNNRIVEFRSIKHTLQSWISRYNRYTLNGVSNQNPLYRFYAQEWESDNPVYWWQLRYYNLLTNGMTITRDIPKYNSELYYYYTKTPKIPQHSNDTSPK